MKAGQCVWRAVRSHLANSRIDDCEARRVSPQAGNVAHHHRLDVGCDADAKRRIIPGNIAAIDARVQLGSNPATGFPDILQRNNARQQEIKTVAPDMIYPDFRRAERIVC